MAVDRSYARMESAEVNLTAAGAERLADAQALVEKSRFASSIVMVLYALEIMLKAKICQRLDLSHLPRPFEIHDFGELLILAGLSRRLNEPTAIRVKANWDSIVTGPALHVNDLLEPWNHTWEFLRAAFSTQPELLERLHLGVRSFDQVSEGGLYAITPDYAEMTG
jgi:hypothetical protein